MAKLDFSPDDLTAMVGRLQAHFLEEFELELGRFEIEALLDVFAAEIGGHYYNRGLYDVQALIAQKMDDVNDAIYQLEMPVTR